MSHYTHFTIEERILSRFLMMSGLSVRAIARTLNRAPSTISRELKRNANKQGDYLPYLAEQKYRHRRKNCGKKPILKNDSDVKQYIIDCLMQEWSPDEIAGRIRLTGKFPPISYNTIYRSIAKGYIPKKYRKHLRFKKIKNRKRKKNDRRGSIADRVMIVERPNEINNRTEFGHWEGDTVLGRRNTGAIGTLVERLSRFTISFRMDNLKNDVFREKAVEAFLSYPKCCKKSITVDNGKEFLSHKLLSKQTGMNIYFCEPYSPWQRGTNEYTNHLIRQYYPKGTSFSIFNDTQLQAVIDKLNNRPRKVLGYKTPNEVFFENLKKCCT